MQNWTLEKLTDWLMTNGEGEGGDRRAEERGRESHKSQMTQRKTEQEAEEEEARHQMKTTKYGNTHE